MNDKENGKVIVELKGGAAGGCAEKAHAAMQDDKEI